MSAMSFSQDQMRKIAHAVARVLIGSFLLAKSIGLVIDPAGMEQYLAILDVPDYLMWPNTGFMVLASLAIIIGFQTRLAAALMALYIFWTSFILNYRPGDPVAIGAFWGDLAMIGGLLMLFSHGRGCLALDSFLARWTDEKDAEAFEADIIEQAEVAPTA